MAKCGRNWHLAVFLIFSLILHQWPVAKASEPVTSLFDIGNYGSGHHQIDALLAHRDLDHPLLQKATLIIKTKLTGSTVLQEAAAKLIKTCRTSLGHGHTSSSSTGAQKEAAQQIYAIKATDHSLSSASQISPKTCNIFCARGSLSWFQKAPLQATDPDGLNESAMHQQRAHCIQDLFKVNNLWTSYSNHLQDARTLCEVGSSDHAPRAILELLGDIAQAVPPVVEILKDAAIRQHELRDQLRNNAKEAEALHRDRLRKEEELHASSMHRTGEIFSTLQKQASQLETSLQMQLLHTNEDVDAVSQALQASVTDIWTLRDTATLLLQHCLSGLEDVSLAQSKGIEDIERSFMSSMHSMDLAAGGVFDQFEMLSVSLRTGMVDMSDQLENISQRQHEVAALQEDSKLQLLQVLNLGKRVNEAISAIDGKIGGLLRVIEACEDLIQHLSLRGLLAAVGVVGSALLLKLICCSSAGAIFFLFCVSAAAAPAVCDMISSSLVIVTSRVHQASSETTALAITHATALALGSCCAIIVMLVARLWHRKLAKEDEEQPMGLRLEKGLVVPARHIPTYNPSLRAQSAPPDLSGWKSA